MRFTPFVAAAALLAACQAAETPEQMQARIETESAAARTAIEAQNARAMRYFAAAQPDSFAMLYTPSGSMMPPGMPRIAGRDSMVAMMTGMFSQMSGATLTLTTASVMANGPMAIERGNWTIGTGDAPPSRGKYLVHWHLVNGEWLMADDMWNDDTPPAGQM